MDDKRNPKWSEPNALHLEPGEAELDIALASYARVAPRPGLEQRILARIAAAPERRPNLFAIPRRWVAGIGFALLAAVLLAVAWAPTQPAPRSLAVGQQKALPLPGPAAPVAAGPATQHKLAGIVRAKLLKPGSRQATNPVLSKPFPIRQPTPQQRLLLSANQAQRKALFEALQDSPIAAPPVEISKLHIEPITTKPLTP